MVLEILVWERGNVGIGQLEGRLQNSVRHALCDVLIEYYLLMASFSFIPERYFANTYSQQYFKWRNIEKPSSYLSVNIDRSELLTEAKLSHRRTPSAGLLGCGQKHSPVAPSPVLRSSASEPVSPVCFGRSVSSLAGGKLPDTHDETPSDFILTVDDEGKGMKTSDVKRLDGRSRQTVSHSASGQKKHRSHSVGSRPRTGNQQALTRTLSTPTSRNVRADSEPKSIPIVNKLEPKNEKFSPYETFTENELTESKEFSGEAVRANNLLSAGDGNPSTRSHSFTRKTSSKSAGGIPTEQEIEVNQRSSKEQKEERMKYENGEKGELHPR